jgi:prepilin-type N-terminal cleavage/methylation domain-containing protein
MKKSVYYSSKIRQHRGFTLIELLVVVSIIALLLSILMPALSKVKEAGRKTVCASHMHDLNLSLRIYAEREDNKLPPMYLVLSDGTQDNNQLANHYSRWWRIGSDWIWNLGLLWTSGVVEDTGEIFYCPSPNAPFTYKDYSRNGFPTDYQPSGAGATGVRISYSFNPECESRTNRNRKYSNITDLTSSTILLLDVLSPLGITHIKGWNVLKGDGSVDFSISREAQKIIEDSGDNLSGSDYDAFDEVIRILKR